MVESPHHSSRNGSKVRLVVLHTAEGALTTASLGRWFARPDVKASSHVGIDDRSIVQYVPYDRAAWTLRSGNKISDNAELCGFAKWNRNQWVADHRDMLVLAAAWIRNRCAARNIPVRKLTVREIRDGKAGVIGHVDWTNAMNDGTHTDPGAAFPWDIVMALANNDAPFPTLRRGDTGPLVERVQRFLGVVGPSDPGYGTFGPKTEAKVRAYQKMRGIPVTGVFDALTWANSGLK